MYGELSLASCILVPHQLYSLFFFFNDTATTEIYTLSLHDALPICPSGRNIDRTSGLRSGVRFGSARSIRASTHERSEEHTSELQSLAYLVCRLLLEKKKKQGNSRFYFSAYALSILGGIISKPTPSL